jgi:hypothetical protein
MKYLRVALVLVVAACFITSAGWAQNTIDKQTKSYIDLMRKDLRQEKHSVVDLAMELDAAQKSQFWAIYADYDAALDKIWDQRLANIKAYAGAVDKMTNEIADQLAVKMMDIEAQRSALRKKFYGMYKEKMGARTAARFLMVETSLACLMDVKLASEIPLLK